MISWFFPGGRWWLRCVLYYRWGKPYHIPHLQQILLPQHCKKTNNKKEDKEMTHLSFFKSFKTLFFTVVVFVCDVQDSYRFGQHISKAMLDIRSLFETENCRRTVDSEKQVLLENGKKHMWQRHTRTNHESLCRSSLVKTKHCSVDWVALSHFRSWPFHSVRHKRRFLFIFIYISELHCFWCCKSKKLCCYIRNIIFA